MFNVLRFYNYPRINKAVNIKDVLRIINKTKFGNHNKFDDKVSKDILSVMASSTDPVCNALITLAVRYRSSPRALARHVAKGCTETVNNSVMATQTWLTHIQTNRLYGQWSSTGFAPVRN